VKTFLDKKSQSGRSALNNGSSGISMPSMGVKIIQPKQMGEEDLSLQAKFTVQRKEPGDDEEALQMKSIPLQLQAPGEEEESTQMKPFQIKGDTVQKQAVDEEEESMQMKPFQLKSDVIQKKEPGEEEPLQSKFIPVQRKANTTGLPDNLKSGVENLSGIDISDVKVHYNSDKPAQLQALAYAQGTDIHVGPGQEKHLPHEAWHVVQQKQGRVQPTIQMKEGFAINDDKGLETEADVMGQSASTFSNKVPVMPPTEVNGISGGPFQLASEIEQIGRGIAYETKRFVENEKSDQLVVNGVEYMFAASSGAAVLDPSHPMQGTPVSDSPTKAGIYTNGSYISTSNGNHVTRCHAINAKYGGLDRFINLFPQDKDVNDAHSEQAEEAVKAKIITANKINEDNDLDEDDPRHLSVMYSYAVHYPGLINPENFHQITLDWDTKFIDGEDKDVDISSSVVSKVDGAISAAGWGLRPEDRDIGEDEIMSAEEEQIDESSDSIPASAGRLGVILSFLSGLKEAINKVEHDDKGGVYTADIACLRQIIKLPRLSDDEDTCFAIIDDHFHTVVSCWTEEVDSLFRRNPAARMELKAALQVTDV
jgi:hypothetical protein